MRKFALYVACFLSLSGPVLAQDSGEISYWESVRDSKNPAELQAYLATYPQGKFTALATAKIAALGGAPAANKPIQTPAPAAAAAPKAGGSFAETDLSGRSFVGKNLDGADFTGATLKDTSFQGASVRSGIFKETDFRGSNLSGGDFTGSDFREALMPFFAQVTNLSRTNFEGLDMRSAHTFQVNFNGANLKGTTGWDYVTACTFRGADLRGANLATVRPLGGTETLNDIFAGAIYDSTTRWPKDVDLATLKARRVD